MTLFLLSLTGIPPLAGFFGKFYVILAAIEVGQGSSPLAGWLTALAILTMLNATVAAFYYLRIVVYMFMRDPGVELPRLRHGRLVWGGLAISTVLTVILGLFPNLLLTIVGDAARVFAEAASVAGS
jgi:NADH-quinone oxidoreductase subunit N